MWEGYIKNINLAVGTIDFFALAYIQLIGQTMAAVVSEQNLKNSSQGVW